MSTGQTRFAALGTASSTGFLAGRASRRDSAYHRGMGKIRMQRAYSAPDGGYRILVDRLWPRGIAKEDAELDEWAKDVAPSPELRTWFNHREHRFDEFREQYIAELEDGPATEEAERLLELIKDQDDVVLVYATKDEEHNNAVVLLEFLDENL